MKRIIIAAAVFAMTAANLDAQRLIIRMDDIGASHSENLAVIHCYQNGIGRSAEVMSVCPWFMEAANMLNENPGLDVGVHIALRSEWVGYKWRPLTNCPSLCDEDGFLNFNFGAPTPDMKEVEAEIRAQIEMAMKHVKNVTHITDHCMWTMMPGMHELAVRIAESYGLRYQGQASEDEAIGILNLPMPFGGPGSYTDNLLNAIKKMEKGKTYWTIEHPAFDNDEMSGIYEIDRNGKKSNVGAQRQAVTDAFTDPTIMKYIKDNGIELVSFGDVIKENKK